MPSDSINRRTFVGQSVATGAALGWAASAVGQEAANPPPRRVRVGVIGCGNVSGVYLPHLSRSAHVELVGACDIIPERARNRAEQFRIPNSYPNIDAMLAGAAFD